MAHKLPEKIPFNQKGDLYYHEPTQWHVQQNAVLWLDNTPFKAKLKLTDYSVTASSVAFRLETNDGRWYHMLTSEFKKLFPLTLTDGWTNEETWVVRKHPGNVYGLTRIDQ